MQKWTAGQAEIILGELDLRLKLIARLQELVDQKSTDELHDLQPLFERGLWMFGPEYESVDFYSNRGLSTIIKKFLGGTDKVIAKARPDFVALPDSSIGVYSASDFNSEGEVSGVRKILIVELKKGGFRLTQRECDQARDYAKELKKANDVKTETTIVVYILGATTEDGLTSAKYGNAINVEPMIYRTLLDRAHARTFNLQRRIQATAPALSVDEDIESLLAKPQEQDLPMS